MIDQLILVNGKCDNNETSTTLHAFAAILAILNTKIQANKVIKFVFILAATTQITIFPSDVGTYFW